MMRASLNPADAAYERTRWLLDGGARIVVKLDGVEQSDVWAADEERGLVVYAIDGGFLFRIGKVEMRVALRD